jgi:hypothetical protein
MLAFIFKLFVFIFFYLLCMWVICFMGSSLICLLIISSLAQLTFPCSTVTNYLLSLLVQITFICLLFALPYHMCHYCSSVYCRNIAILGHRIVIRLYWLLTFILAVWSVTSSTCILVSRSENFSDTPDQFLHIQYYQ